MRHSEVGLYHYYESKLRVIEKQDVLTKKKNQESKLPWVEFEEHTNANVGDIIVTIEHWYCDLAAIIVISTNPTHAILNLNTGSCQKHLMTQLLNAFLSLKYIASLSISKSKIHKSHFHSANLIPRICPMLINYLLKIIDQN